MGWRDLFGIGSNNSGDNDNEGNGETFRQTFQTSTSSTTCKPDPDDEQTLICVEEIQTVDKNGGSAKSQKQFKIPKGAYFMNFPVFTDDTGQHAFKDFESLISSFMLKNPFENVSNQFFKNPTSPPTAMPKEKETEVPKYSSSHYFQKSDKSQDIYDL